jgi:hypothetical protein
MLLRMNYKFTMWTRKRDIFSIPSNCYHRPKLLCTILHLMKGSLVYINKDDLLFVVISFDEATACDYVIPTITLALV